MKTAYSYVRLSSAKQIDGTGAARQLEKAESICQQQGWNLSPQSFDDLNVSGFKGKNRLKGALATFIQLNKDKKLAAEPILIIEQFDRWSRQDIDESEPTLLELLKSGVAVHVSFTGKTFTAESVKDLGSRIEILLSLKSAYEYSANLSKRIKSAKIKRREEIARGEHKKHNLVPKYFTWNEETKRYDHNEHTQLIKDIVAKYLAGYSLYGISRHLFKSGIKTLKTGSNYSPVTVKCILTSRTLFGEYLGNPNFFEPIIDKATFDRVQLRLSQNVSTRGKESTLYNFFRGLSYCECGVSMNTCCNSSYYRHKKKLTKSYRYFRCCSSGKGCSCGRVQMMSLDRIEEEFFGIFLMKNPKQLLSEDDSTEAHTLNQQIKDKQTQLLKLDKDISKLIDLSLSVDVPELKTKLTTLEKQRVALKSELDSLNLQLSSVQSAPTDFTDLKTLLNQSGTDVTDLDAAFRSVMESLKDNDVRRQVGTVLKNLIGKIVFDPSNHSWRVVNRSGKDIYKSDPIYSAR